MPIEFVIDLVEAQEGITYMMGLSLQALAIGDSLSSLCVYQAPAKGKHSPKLEQKISLALNIVLIVVQGEPQESLPADSSAQIGLEGDISPLMNLLQAHKWHHKNGRYVLPHNESRIISLQGD